MGLTRPTVKQLNTVITEISDPISVLNKGSTLANVDVGFVFNRDGGISSNIAFYWNETTDAFNLVSTTSTGGANSNIAVVAYSDLRIRDLTGNTASFSGNGAIKIPTGNTVQRTAGTTGEIRFNTTTSQFEGYQGTSWSSLGGVRSVDNATYIIAEAYPGAGNNALYFYTNNTLQGNLSSTGFNLTGNVLATTGTFNGLTVNGTVSGFLNATGNITAANITASYFIGRGDALTGINAFGNVFISGQSPVLADTTFDTLTLVSGTGIAITTDAANDSVTISTVSTTGPFAASGDFGDVVTAVTVSEDEGLVTDAATVTYDLGSIIAASGLIYPDLLVLPSYATATLPSATITAQLAYNTTKQTPTFTDGSNWYEVGYKDMPQVAAGNVTLGITDSGKHYYSTSGAPLTITVPSYSNVALPVGAAIMVVNRGVGSITVTPQVEVSMYLAGNTTSASRTIASYCLASLIKTESNVWIISGVGVY